MMGTKGGFWNFDLSIGSYLDFSSRVAACSADGDCLLYSTFSNMQEKAAVFRFKALKNSQMRH